MKKIYFLMLVAMIVVTSSLSKAISATYDKGSAKAELTKTLDELKAAFMARDANTVMSFYTEDGLFCGTDPTEFWDKTAYSKMIKDMLADKTTNMDMKMEIKEIRVAKDGMSAIVVGQSMAQWSKPILIRDISHFVKVNGKWKIDFSSVALIPENKDLPKITAAVKVD